MAKPAIYQQQTYAIPANQFVDLYGDWDYFLLLSATDPNNIQIAFNEDGFQPLTYGIAIGGLRSLGVTRVRLKDTSGALNTVVVSTGGASISLSSSSALPPGASTAALQNTGNASLASIDTKLTAPLSVVINNGVKRTYTVNIDGAAPASGNYVLAAIEAGAGVGFRLRRLIVSVPGSQTAAARQRFEIVRTTAASSGGSLQTPAPRDAADAAFSGIARITNPTITAGAALFTFSLVKPTAVTTAPGYTPFVVSFDEHNTKPIVVPAGVANGIALREINGAAGAANFCATLEFTEE